MPLIVLFMVLVGSMQGMELARYRDGFWWCLCASFDEISYNGIGHLIISESVINKYSSAE